MRDSWPAARHPAVMISVGFGTAVLIGTLLLGLPVATTEGDSSHWLTALFTATSAVCVTGLIVVDTETHWSVFGEVVIVFLIQVGGLGIMTLATLIIVMRFVADPWICLPVALAVIVGGLGYPVVFELPPPSVRRCPSV